MERPGILKPYFKIKVGGITLPDIKGLLYSYINQNSVGW